MTFCAGSWKFSRLPTPARRSSMSVSHAVAPDIEPPMIGPACGPVSAAGDGPVQGLLGPVIATQQDQELKDTPEDEGEGGPRHRQQDAQDLIMLKPRAPRSTTTAKFPRRTGCSGRGCFMRRGCRYRAGCTGRHRRRRRSVGGRPGPGRSGRWPRRWRPPRVRSGRHDSW